MEEADSTTQATYDQVARNRKEDLYMFMAWWMEFSPWVDKTKGNQMGVVIAKPDTIILDVDCTRDSRLHPVQYLLAKHRQKTQGCDLYLSRAPCSTCAKCIVQAKVRKVFYWPFKPEVEDKEDMKCVEKLFQKNPVGVSVIVPTVSKSVYERTEQMRNYPSEATIKPTNTFAGYKIWSKTGSNDPDHEPRTKKLHDDLEQAKRWIDLVTVRQVGDQMSLKKVGNSYTMEKTSEEYKVDLHSSRMANMLSTRSDDPKIGVGAVILTKNGSILEYASIGWSGFPRGAQITDYPRTVPGESKDPFIVHAEYNAIQYRNTDNLNKGRMYVSINPCDDCYNVLAKLGVKQMICPKRSYENDNGDVSARNDMDIFCYESTAKYDK